MALNSLFCADVPLRNYSLTHSGCNKVRLFPVMGGVMQSQMYNLVLTNFDISVTPDPFCSWKRLSSSSNHYEKNCEMDIVMY